MLVPFLEAIFELLNSKGFWISTLTVLTPIVIKTLGQFLSSHKKTQRQTINQDNIINHFLAELKHQTDASLVFIFKYHNGGITYDGKPMEKMTMFYLRDSEKIQVDSSRYTGIPIAHWGDMVYYLYNKGNIDQDEILTSNKVEDLKDNRYRSMMLALNAQSHYAVPVFKKVWKIDFTWESWRYIFLPFRRERVLISSIHVCLNKPYNHLHHSEIRTVKAKVGFELISEKIRQELLK
jgi:hypothetical protein